MIEVWSEECCADGQAVTLVADPDGGDVSLYAELGRGGLALVKWSTLLTVATPARSVIMTAYIPGARRWRATFSGAVKFAELVLGAPGASGDVTMYVGR